jgi:pimeloyl-ACP methyl ester carboxylesterase
MATFVLVHGAWHGAWCWRDIVPLLEAGGHHVFAPDLPGHGEHAATIAEMTLESYARCVQQSIEAAPEPVVLVAHSMGGIVATQAAEYVPERIRRLVYVTAFLPADGQSLPELSGSVDGGDGVIPNLVADERAGTCVVAEQALRPVFYGECGEDDVRFCLGRLVPESLAAIAAPVRVSAGRAGRIPRAYIECVRDGAVTIPLQRHMRCPATRS